MPTPVRVLEIGGTHVTAACVDPDGWRVHERNRTPLDSRAPASDILATLVGAATTLAGRQPSSWAVAVPDPFDYPGGIALFRDVGKFDHLYGVDVGGALRSAIDPRPSSLTFVHDVEAFLLGEWTAGAAAGTARCAALTLGTGVGSAFLADGAVVSDHPRLPPGGRIHRCELDGVPLEDLVSRRAIRAHFAAATGDTAADVRDIADRARAGDGPAAAVLHAAFETAGRALAHCLAAFAAEVVVVGGSMARSWDLLEPPLRSGLERDGVRADVRPAEQPDDAPLIGAARLLTPARAAIGA